MYLKVSTNAKTGRTYLSAVHGYRDPMTKKSKSKTIESFGFLDELEKAYDDPIAHFKAYVAKLDAQRLDEKNNTVSYNPSERVDDDCMVQKCLGYAPFSQIYHRLDLAQLLQSRQRKHQVKFNLNNIFKLLVYARILYPASKLKTHTIKHLFLDNTDFTRDDIYRSLSIFPTYKNAIIEVINKRIDQLYKRDTRNVYYDVTNYYFETYRETGKKKKGYSKEKQRKPIIQMGLLMDNDGIPMTYKTFPGNMLDKETLLPILDELKDSYHLGRMIIVSDRGINTYDNLAYNIIKKNGYVVGQSIRGATAALKAYVLDQTGYQGSDSFKIKSRITPRTFRITNADAQKKNVDIDQKQVVYYSEKYAKKARHDRQALLDKVVALIRNPKCKEKISNYGAAKYIKNLHIDKKTKKIIHDAKFMPEFDTQKLEEDMKYDGYYCLITSELNKSDQEIIDIYRGLWEIEECFKITKSTLELSPLFLSDEQHIEAHFLTCFVALVLTKLFKRLMNHTNYSLFEMIETLSNAKYTLADTNNYLACHHSKILHEIGDVFDIPYRLKGLTLGKMKQIVAQSKK